MSTYLNDYNDPYCYENTNILKNLKNIRNQDKLDQYERIYTAKRLYSLLNQPLAGKFDLKHLQQIHQFIFQDVYPFAGKLRTVNIGKGVQFCPIQHVESYFEENVTKQLKVHNYLIGLKIPEFIIKASEFFAEVNAIHPFREGNGRAQREFFRCLALKNGYKLNWELVSQQEMIDASKESMVGNLAGLVKIFQKVIQ